MLVVVDGDAGLGQLGVEQLPQVHEVGLEHALLRLGEQAVRESLERKMLSGLHFSMPCTA